MCQPKECVQRLEAAKFVCHELKTDDVFGCLQRAGLGVVGGFGKRPPGTEAPLKN